MERHGGFRWVDVPESLTPAGDDQPIARLLQMTEPGDGHTLGRLAPDRHEHMYALLPLMLDHAVEPPFPDGEQRRRVAALPTPDLHLAAEVGVQHTQRHAW